MIEHGTSIITGLIGAVIMLLFALCKVCEVNNVNKRMAEHFEEKYREAQAQIEWLSKRIKEQQE